MARASTSASGTADQTVVTGAGVLRGFNAVETAATAAAAEVQLTDGVAGQVLAHVTLGADGSQIHWFGDKNGDQAGGGIAYSNGVVVDRISGTTEVTVYVD